MREEFPRLLRSPLLTASISEGAPPDRLFRAEDDARIGRITRGSGVLIAHLEEEDSEDTDYYVDHDTLEFLKEHNPPQGLIRLLESALEGRDGLEVYYRSGDALSRGGYSSPVSGRSAGCRALLGQQLGNGASNRVQIERFRDVGIGAAGQDGTHRLGGIVGGHDDDHHRVVLFADALQEIHPRERRHAQVKKEQIEGVSPDTIQSLGAVMHGFREIPIASQPRHQDTAQVLLIICHQNPHRVTHPSLFPFLAHAPGEPPVGLSSSPRVLRERARILPAYKSEIARLVPSLWGLGD